jgi:anti-sigma regulatory factor (Ser/Thr protein kinase)
VYGVCIDSEGRAVPVTRESLVYERAVPAAPANVGLVRRELDSALEREQVESVRRSDIVLVLGEAASNVVLHAYRPLPPGLLFVDAAITGRNLLLRVCDCGRGMRPRADSPGLGIGLSLMGRLADGLEIGRNRSMDGTRVCAMFRDVAPTEGRMRGATPRAEAAIRREYQQALAMVNADLRSDTEALIAQATQAVAQSQRLRAERSHA